MTYDDEFHDDELTDEDLDELELEEDLETGDLDDEELAEVLRGDFGPELQARALELTESDQGDDGDHRWVQQFQASQEQLEQKLGRQLTSQEIDRFAEYHEPSDNPDLVNSYDQVIGRDMRDKDDRQAIAAEAYEDQRDALAEEGRDLAGNEAPGDASPVSQGQ